MRNLYGSWCSLKVTSSKWTFLQLRQTQHANPLDINDGEKNDSEVSSSLFIISLNLWTFKCYLINVSCDGALKDWKNLDLYRTACTPFSFEKLPSRSHRDILILSHEIFFDINKITMMTMFWTLLTALE